MKRKALKSRSGGRGRVVAADRERTSPAEKDFLWGRETAGTLPRPGLPPRLVKYIEQEYEFTPELPETHQGWADLHGLVDVMPLGLFLLLHARSDMIPLDDSLLPGRLGPDTLQAWCKGGADVEYLGGESPYRDRTEALDFVVTPLGPRSRKPRSRKRFFIRVYPTA